MRKAAFRCVATNPPLARMLIMAMSADGKVAVSAWRDGTLKVWDVESGRVRWMLEGHAGPVLGVAVSADGKVAISAS